MPAELIPILDIFAWPIVAFLGLLLFRSPLVTLLNRAKKLSTTGIETFDTPLPQQIDDKRGIDEFLRTFDNKLLVEAEEVILNDLKERKIEAAKDRETALVKSLASSHIRLYFETTYGWIWASQVALLRILNPRGDGIQKQEIRFIYDDAKAEFPQLYQANSFDQWLAFLVSAKFITGDGDRVAITIAGREFLQYLVATGKAGPFNG